MTEVVRSLYVHVPFCAHKCEYCAFYSEASSGEITNRYVAAIVRELELVAHDLKPRTVFFGGGTPSILNLRQWEQILRTMDRLNLLGAAEWTVECNPATVSLDKARLLRDFGVNRISMGVQSLDEKLLDRLGRIHSREQVFKSFDTLRAAGFDNLNVDLMFAIPGQTMDIWHATLNEALALGSEHLSCYEVIYEQDTPLFAQLQAGEFDVDEDLACDMYEELIERSAAAGFVQYEVANFAKNSKPETRNSKLGIMEERGTSPRPSPHLAPPPLPNAERENPSPSHPKTCDWTGRTRSEVTGSGHSMFPLPGGEGQGEGGRQSNLHCAPDAGQPPDTAGNSKLETRNPELPSQACRHNVNYWRGGDYYGLGPSATGYVRGVRTRNWSNTQMYCEQIEKGNRAFESREELPPLKRAGETAAFGLRMNAGWPFADFERATGFDLRGEWAGDMKSLAERGWAELRPERFQLTRQGLRFADAAAEVFLR